MLLKTKRVKGVAETLEINDILTKVKCLNALVNRIKYGTSYQKK